MKPTIYCAFLCALALHLAGCAQFTTSNSQRADLQSAADTAGNAYIECVGKSAERYLATGEDARTIATIARKACAEPRAAAGRAQTALVSTQYILAEPQVQAALKALDEQAEAAITRQLLDRRAAAPTPDIPVDGNSYLACMQAQGERHASVNEPADVIAEVAHSRCAASLAGNEAADQLERRGRALVMGLVLDRKAGIPR